MTELTKAMTPAPALRLNHPEDVAYLRDGPELTMLAALSAMHVAGRIAPSGRRCVQAVGLTYASDLEKAIHLSTQHPVPPATLPCAPPVADALNHIERRLLHAGLLLPAEQRISGGLGCLDSTLVALVAIVGVVGLVANPLAGVLILLVVAWAVTSGRNSGTWGTDRGDAELSRLRAEHADLSPRLRPDSRVAMRVALLGASALSEADPAFAAQLGVSTSADGC